MVVDDLVKKGIKNSEEIKLLWEIRGAKEHLSSECLKHAATFTKKSFHFTISSLLSKFLSHYYVTLNNLKVHLNYNLWFPKRASLLRLLLFTVIIKKSTAVSSFTTSHITENSSVPNFTNKNLLENRHSEWGGWNVPK